MYIYKYVQICIYVYDWTVDVAWFGVYRIFRTHPCGARHMVIRYWFLGFNSNGASGGMAGGADALPLLREVCLRTLDSVTRESRGLLRSMLTPKWTKEACNSVAVPKNEMLWKNQWYYKMIQHVHSPVEKPLFAIYFFYVSSLRWNCFNIRIKAPNKNIFPRHWYNMASQTRPSSPGPQHWTWPPPTWLLCFQNLTMLVVLIPIVNM